MLLTIPTTLIQKMKEKGVTNPLITGAKGYGKMERIESRGFTKAEFEMLYDMVKALPKGTPLARQLQRSMDQVFKLTSGAGRGKITDLQICAEAIRELIASTETRWVFDVDEDTQLTLPYLVTEVKYVPSERRKRFYRPAYVRVEAEALVKGKSTSVSGTIHAEDLKGGVTAQHALETTGLMLATPALIDAYNEEMSRYGEMKKGVGTQYTAVGEGDTDKSGDYYWHNSSTNLTIDGKPGKVVLDDEDGWGSDANTATVDDWATGFFKDIEARKREAERARDEAIEAAKENEKNQPEDDEDEDDEDEDDWEDLSSELHKVVEEDNVRKLVAVKVMRVPEHPYVRVFSLAKHIFATTHIANLEDYFYQRAIFDKLVLPPEIKTLIDALVDDTKEGDDIIVGKGQGVIILLYGPPGCGKTLSAEAYSEKVKRPLYTVQCAQLGTTAESLEKELVTVLKRAERWNALLLIDEADVYIHERGNDVNQNAMVGVFLRLLEYYKGVLFLTTNRQGQIDDAVRSRCIAEIYFDRPEAKDANRIWQIMFDQYKITAVDESVFKSMGLRANEWAVGMSKDLVKAFPKFTGRTIKHTTRLAKLLAGTDGKKVPEMEHFKIAAKFQDLEVGKGGGAKVGE